MKKVTVSSAAEGCGLLKQCSQQGEWERDQLRFEFEQVEVERLDRRVVIVTDESCMGVKPDDKKNATKELPDGRCNVHCNHHCTYDPSSQVRICFKLCMESWALQRKKSDTISWAITMSNSRHIAMRAIENYTWYCRWLWWEFEWLAKKKYMRYTASTSSVWLKKGEDTEDVSIWMDECSIRQIPTSCRKRLKRVWVGEDPLPAEE